MAAGVMLANVLNNWFVAIPQPIIRYQREMFTNAFHHFSPQTTFFYFCPLFSTSFSGQMGYFNWMWFCGIYKLLWLIHVHCAFLNQNQSSARLALLGKILYEHKTKWLSNVRRINWIVTINFLIFQLENWFWCQTICFQYLGIQWNTSFMANFGWSYWFSKWLPFAHIIYRIFCYFSTRKPNFGLKLCFQYKII